MNFALTRSKYKGPVNYFAYFGMLGDIAVMALLYGAYKYKKDSNKKAKEANKETQKLNALTLFPKKIEEIDYNKFSPYTPIPYYVSKTTKYQHAHIDLVGYLNENQLNFTNSYYKNYHHNDSNKMMQFDWHDPYHLHKKHGAH